MPLSVPAGRPPAADRPSLEPCAAGPRRGAARLLWVVLALVVVSGCAAAAPTTSTSDTFLPPPRTEVSDGTTPGTVPACGLDALRAAAVRAVPGATLDDVTCGPPGSRDAAATLIAEGATDQVGLFAANGGTWTILERRPVDADPATFVPPEFNLAVYRSWQDKYELRRRPAEPRPTGPRTSSTMDPAETPAVCRKEAGTIVCKDPNPTTTAPTTTTTKVTTTRAPTTTPPPVTASVPPTTPAPPSPFCLANPFDPRCGIDPSFPG